MALHLGSRRFAPTWPMTLLTIVGVALTCWLGSWQLSRADQKRELARQYAFGEKSVVDLNSSPTEPSRYQRVTATGRYDTHHQVLLDNMPSASGRPGYRVLTPFMLTNGRWMLIDRGWLPLGATRSDLPRVDVGEEGRTLSGRLDDLPRPGMRLAAVTASNGPWPRVMNFPELATLEAALDRKLEPRILRLDPEAADGYERVREARAGFGPERHVGYAVQWFALAATMLVVYVLLNLKVNRSDDNAISS